MQNVKSSLVTSRLGKYSPATLEIFIEEVFRRATAKAALAAAYARGRNNRHFADELAVDALRYELNEKLPVGAEIIIGEGERDQAPQLFIGERLGPEQDQVAQLHIAVDPLEGTNLAAQWINGAICVVAGALVGEGKLLRGIDGYMHKFVCGKVVADRLKELQCGASSEGLPPMFNPNLFILDQPIEAVAHFISWCTGKPTSSLVAEILDRPRNADLIQRLRQLHVQVRLITDGDVAAAWRALDDRQEVDFTVGIGAASEGVIAAAMANVLQGYMETRCWLPEGEAGEYQQRKWIQKKVDLHKVHTISDLADGNVIVAFTAVTDSVIPGVTYGRGGVAYTHTIVGRSRTGTHYTIQGNHKCPPPPPASYPVSD